MQSVLRQPLAYRHGFHAGNHGDVLKHVILTQMIGASLRNFKNRQVLYVDTHSGPGGVYKLDSEAAQKKKEYAAGAGRIHDLARLAIHNQIPPFDSSSQKLESLSRLGKSRRPRRKAHDKNTNPEGQTFDEHQEENTEPPQHFGLIEQHKGYEGDLSLSLFAPSSDLYSGIDIIHGMPSLKAHSVLRPRTTGKTDTDLTEEAINLDRTVRSLLPLPIEVLPYVATLFVANEPQNLDSLVESSTVGKIKLDEHEIQHTNVYKLKTLQERAKAREKMNGGKFVHRAGLNVFTKSNLMKAVSRLGASPTESNASARFDACDDIELDLLRANDEFLNPSHGDTQYDIRFDPTKGKPIVPLSRRQAKGTVYVADAMPATPFHAHANPERIDLRAPGDGEQELNSISDVQLDKNDTGIEAEINQKSNRSRSKRQTDHSQKTTVRRTSSKNQTDSRSKAKSILNTLEIDSHNIPSNLKITLESNSSSSTKGNSRKPKNSLENKKEQKQESKAAQEKKNSNSKSQESFSSPYFRVVKRAMCSILPSFLQNTGNSFFKWPELSFSNDLSQSLTVRRLRRDKHCRDKRKTSQLLPKITPVRFFSSGSKHHEYGGKNKKFKMKKIAEDIENQPLSKRKAKALKWERQKARLKIKKAPSVKRPSNRVEALSSVGLDRKNLIEEKIKKQKQALMSDVEIASLRSSKEKQKASDQVYADALSVSSSTAFCLFNAPAFLPLQKGARTTLRALPSSPFIFHSLMDPQKDQLFLTELHSSEYMSLLDQYVNQSLSQKFNYHDRVISSSAKKIAKDLPEGLQIEDESAEAFFDEENSYQKTKRWQSQQDLQFSNDHNGYDSTGTLGKPVVTEREFLRLAAAEVGWSYLTPERETALRLKHAEQLKTINIQILEQRRSRRRMLGEALQNTDGEAIKGEQSESSDVEEVNGISKLIGDTRLAIDVVDVLLRKSPGVIVQNKDGPRFLQRLAAFVGSQHKLSRSLPLALINWTKPENLLNVYSSFLKFGNNQHLAQNLQAFEAFAAAEVRFAETLAEALGEASISQDLSRRPGLVLIDPAYEGADEYVAALEALRTTRMMWPDAQILIWYPILNPKHEKAENPSSADAKLALKKIHDAEAAAATNGESLYSIKIEEINDAKAKRQKDENGHGNGNGSLASRLLNASLRHAFQSTPRHLQRDLFLEVAHRMIEDQQLRRRQRYASILLDNIDAEGDESSLHFDIPSRQAIRKRQLQLVKSLLEASHDATSPNGSQKKSNDLIDQTDIVPKALEDVCSVRTIVAELNVRKSPSYFTSGSGVLIVNPIEKEATHGQLQRSLPWLSRVLSENPQKTDQETAPTYVLEKRDY